MGPPTKSKVGVHSCESTVLNMPFGLNMLQILSSAVMFSVAATANLAYDASATISAGTEMNITISGSYRKEFAAHLRSHRDSYSLNDADYARDVLRISLNTFKKCIQESNDALSLKRQTFIAIFENADLTPSAYGLQVSLPVHENQYGGYDKRSYAYLCGRFILYRRSFLTAENINKCVLQIQQSPTRECLSFSEVHSYMSDGGVQDEHRYSGDIYIDKDRAMLSFPSYRAGQVRLTLIQMPQRPINREKIKMRGALLTFGIPRGYWQPTVSCIFAEGPVADTTPAADLCGTIYAGSDEHQRVSVEIAHTEENSVVLTPLLWHKLRNLEGSKLTYRK